MATDIDLREASCLGGTLPPSLDVPVLEGNLVVKHTYIDDPGVENVIAKTTFIDDPDVENVALQNTLLPGASIADTWSTSDPHVRNSTNACLNSLLPYCQKDIIIKYTDSRFLPEATRALQLRLHCSQSYAAHTHIFIMCSCARGAFVALRVPPSKQYSHISMFHFIGATCASL